MDEIKFRLIKKGVVVGYEKHSHKAVHGIRIYHKGTSKGNWIPICEMAKLHDDKEQLVPLSPDFFTPESQVNEVYENDRIRGLYNGKTVEAVIRYSDGSFFARGTYDHSEEFPCDLYGFDLGTIEVLGRA